MHKFDHENLSENGKDWTHRTILPPLNNLNRIEVDPGVEAFFFLKVSNKEKKMNSYTQKEIIISQLISLTIFSRYKSKKQPFFPYFSLSKRIKHNSFL